MKLAHLAAAIGIASLSSLALAQEYPAPIEALKGKGVEILDTFDAPSDMQGYAALYQGSPLAIYLTSDKKHALIGSMLDAQGEDLTSAIIEEKVSRPQSDILWDRLEKDSHWIAEGSDTAKSTVYVFTDPNCPFCKRLWKDAQPWVESGKVQLRHIPVGVLGQSSRKKAAYILAAKDKTQALMDNE